MGDNQGGKTLEVGSRRKGKQGAERVAAFALRARGGKPAPRKLAASGCKEKGAS